MARLQDFQTVTPTSSDKLLVVQSQGQGLSDINAVVSYGANNTTLSALTTTSKTLVGSINELKSDETIQTLSSGDFNSLTANATKIKYYKGENVSSITNTPLSSAYPFMLEVLPIGSTYTYQRLHTYTSNGSPRTFERQQYYQSGGNAWGAWKEVSYT